MPTKSFDDLMEKRLTPEEIAEIEKEVLEERNTMKKYNKDTKVKGLKKWDKMEKAEVKENAKHEKKERKAIKEIIKHKKSSKK